MTKTDKEGQRKTPILRFKGFTDDWEQRKLQNQVQFFSGLTYSPSDVKDVGTFVIRSSNIKDNTLISADNVYVNPNIANSEPVKKDDVIMVVRNGSKSLIGKHALVTRKIDNTVIGAFMTGIRSSTPYFLDALLDTINFKKEIYKNLGATINQITIGNLRKMTFKVPNESEKFKIGNLFKKLNYLLALYERKIEKLESIYHYFQKNIFKHLYETKDTLNLGDFVSVNTGKLDANAMCNDGKYDFYTSGIKKYKINSFSFSGPAITVAGNGATIGYLHLADGKFDAYQRTYVINNFQGVSRKYIYYTLQYVLPRKIYKESRTGSIPYIVKEMLTGLKIPELDNSTQKLIGGFFYKVNNLITSYKQIHNELTKIKSFCLNTMFI